MDRTFPRSRAESGGKATRGRRPRRHEQRQRRRTRTRQASGIRLIVAMVAVVVVATTSLFGTTRTALSFSVRGSRGPRATFSGSRHASGLRYEYSNSCRNSFGGSSASSFVGGEYSRRFGLADPSRRSRSLRQRRSYGYGASSLVMMPEGPEVRTLVDRLRGGIGKRLVDVRFLSGRYLKQRPRGFFDFAETMTPLDRGKPEKDENRDNSDNDHDNSATVDTILDINCKGKFIYVLLDNGKSRVSSSNINGYHRNDNDADNHDDTDDFQRSIWITLGMTGRFVNEQQHNADPGYGRWVLELVDETARNPGGNDCDNGNGSIPSSSSSPPPPPPPVVHRIHYHDKRNFGTVRFCLSRRELNEKLASLGPDILALARHKARVERSTDGTGNGDGGDGDGDFDPSAVTIDDELAVEASVRDFLGLLDEQRNPKLNVCKFLMDQTKVSGVGNYILSEALHRASVDPFCGIDELSESRRIALFDEIRAVCYESYVSQKRALARTETETPIQSPEPSDGGGAVPGEGSGYASVRSLEPFDFRLRVYGQLRCPKGNPVVREPKGPHGRTVWYTEDQLFVPRYVREQRQGAASGNSSSDNANNNNTSNNNDDNNNDNEDRWTITRRDGIELGGPPDRDSKQPPGVGTNAAIASAHAERNDGEALVAVHEDDDDDDDHESWNLLDGLHEPGWKRALGPYAASSRSFAGLQEFLREEYATHGPNQIYPPRHQIFAALNLCPLDEVKVVILGQDPYHGPNQSTGLAFSVSKTITKIPPSLRNIFRELDDDIGNGGLPPIRHGDLEGWARQGVLMLNTVLTVRRGKANSHQKKGWEDFTDEIVCGLRDHHSGDGGDGIVFLLWGGPAARKARSIVDSDAKHVVITTSHPSPLGATKTASPFLTSRCFSRVNDALVAMGKTPIDWYDR